MPELQRTRAKPPIVDAEFTVVSGPVGVFGEHPSRPGWYFTGEYDSDGDPLYCGYRPLDRHERNKRLIFVGTENGKMVFYRKPFLPEWLQDPITLNRQTWESRTGWKRVAMRGAVAYLTGFGILGDTWRTKGGLIYGVTFFYIPLASTVISMSAVAGFAGLQALIRGLWHWL